jgi:hypothetical protein
MTDLQMNKHVFSRELLKRFACDTPTLSFLGSAWLTRASNELEKSLSTIVTDDDVEVDEEAFLLSALDQE